MSDALRRPVPEDELQRFAADLTTLARALHDLNPDHPEVQSRMNDAEQKMGALTPEQLTMLANAYDRPPSHSPWSV
jgi:predicted DNA binding protein